MLSFAEANQEVLRFNDSFRSYIRDLHANQFNYTAFYQANFKFPADGPMPIPPNVNEGDSPFRSILADAATRINPCFNVYHILDFCPTPFDPAGATGPLPASGPFWDLADVKADMHAPAQVSWTACAPRPVFAGSGQDQSPRPSFTVLPGVFERVPINIVANGALDFLIPSDGALFALQNVTWGGATGFATRPNRTFVVPAEDQAAVAPPGEVSAQKNIGAVGEMGKWHWEAGFCLRMLRAGVI